MTFIVSLMYFILISSDLKKFQTFSYRAPTELDPESHCWNSQCVQELSTSVQNTGSRFSRKNCLHKSFPSCLFFFRSLQTWVKHGVSCFGHVLNTQPIVWWVWFEVPEQIGRKSLVSLMLRVWLMVVRSLCTYNMELHNPMLFVFKLQNSMLWNGVFHW